MVISQAVIDRVPGWTGRVGAIEPLGGGITNRNFRVVVGEDAFVVRIPAATGALLGIDRHVEHQANRLAAGAGVGPEVVAYIQPEGALVTRFIEGQPVSDAAVHEPAMLQRIAQALRRIHQAGSVDASFSPFRVVEAYALTATRHGGQLPADYERARLLAQAIERSLRPEPTVLCHNDLLNANFIDDGATIRIVDWEYAGMGDRFFDFGNFAVNHQLSERDEMYVLAAYFGRVSPGQHARLRLMRLMSDFREAMWGVLQVAISDLDFDFSGYAAKHFERLFTNGASIAYHLVRRGWRDVLLLERAQLTSGSTFHSAGLVGQLRSTLPLTRLMMDSVALYGRLKDETGVEVGWRPVGSLRLASSRERMEELERQAGWGTSFGLPIELLSANEACARFPLMARDGLLGAAFLPTDGYLDPSGLALALAEGARRGGAVIREGVRVTGIEVKAGAVRAVRTEDKIIEAEVVVNAGGIYAPEIAAMAGLTLPIIPMAHQYLVARLPEAIPDDLPTMRDPDLLVYFRRDAGGIVMGGYERDPAPWGLRGIATDFNNRLLPEDWPRFEPLSQNAVRRVPALEHAEVVKLINGPEAFTPDNEFLLGESEVRGFYVAAGFCAHGIAGAGGMGRAMADWIIDGEPSLDLWKMDLRRFGGQYRSQAHTLARTVEVYSTYYDIHYPNEERRAGRPLRLSPTYARLKELGASFGEKSGWERPNWFASNATAPDGLRRPTGWAAQHWSTAIAAEHLATREDAGLFDETSFAKIEVSGAGSLLFLQRLCDNEMGRPVGSITYTQMLNQRGGIECDFTVTRLDEDRFLIVTGTAFGNHDLGWLRKHQPADGSVSIDDVTSAWACLGIWGPRARDILQPLTDADISNAAFPYLTARTIAIGEIPCRTLRVTYVGELGWELYCPIEYGLRLWDTLWNAGSPLGLRAGGYRAIDTLRLEKGYRVWSTDITPDDNPYEAGLGFAVRLNKAVDFIGKSALIEARTRGVSRRLRPLLLEDASAIALGGEPVRVDGQIAGRVTSGGYGYSLDRSIAYAYLPAERAAPGTATEVKIFERWIPAVVGHEPLFDPEGKRIRS